MNIVLDNYTPLISYLSPASIPQIVAHIQDYLVKHPILNVETIAEIIVQSLQEHPELINGEAIPISADSAQSIKAYIDALPALDTYTKAEINQLLLGKQDTLTFDQAPTSGSSNPVTSSGIIAALSALQSALETQIGLKADSASTYTKSQVDTLLEDKADADNVYSKNTIDAKLLEVDTEIDNVNDALDEQSQQIGTLANLETTAKANLVSAINEIYSYKPGDTYKLKKGSVFLAGRTSGGTNNGVYCMLFLSKIINSNVSNISIEFHANTIIRLYFYNTYLTYAGRVVSVQSTQGTNVLTLYIEGAEIQYKDAMCTVEITNVSYDTAIISFQ